MTQDEMKQAVARAALEYVVEGRIVGVGTGSTARLFIEELAGMKDRIVGAVASSEDTRQRLEKHGIRVILAAQHKAIEKTEGGLLNVLDNGIECETDVVMFATGREPYVQNLGLEAAGVELN